MAENIKKLKYEPGDKTDTSDHLSTCPSGHPLSVRRNVRAGQGRVFCTQCGWSDQNQVIGSVPPAQSDVSPFSKPDPRTGGVTIISQHGVENREKPRVFGR